MVNIVNACGDDWAGIYVNGILYRQGHSMSLRDLADAAGGKPFSFEEKAVALEWLHENGELPEHISDVEWEKQ